MKEPNFFRNIYNHAFRLQHQYLGEGNEKKKIYNDDVNVYPIKCTQRFKGIPQKNLRTSFWFQVISICQLLQRLRLVCITNKTSESSYAYKIIQLKCITISTITTLPTIPPSPQLASQTTPISTTTPTNAQCPSEPCEPFLCKNFQGKMSAC